MSLLEASVVGRGEFDSVVGLVVWNCLIAGPSLLRRYLGGRERNIGKYFSGYWCLLVAENCFMGS